MAKDVKVLLIERIRGLGNAGEEKTVSRGYAENYLIPKALALPVNKANVAQIKRIKDREDKRLAKVREGAANIQKKLEGKKITISAKTHNMGKLYGSISPDKIINNIQNTYKVELSEARLENLKSIKEIGDYDVEIKLIEDIACTVKLKVVSEAQEREEIEDVEDDDRNDVADDGIEDTVADFEDS